MGAMFRFLYHNINHDNILMQSEFTNKNPGFHLLIIVSSHFI